MADRGGEMRIWLMAARPRTLPAAIAPVLVGTSLAIHAAGHLPRARVRCRAGRRDADPDRYEPLQRLLRRAAGSRRRGPSRAGARHLGRQARPAAPESLIATYVTFGLAVACGIYLIVIAGWALLAVGAASILAGVLYTGGPRPRGYEGLVRCSSSCSSAWSRLRVLLRAARAARCPAAGGLSIARPCPSSC